MAEPATAAQDDPLPFSRAEYATRLARVRQQMEAAGIEALLTTVPENIVYLTGYSTLGYFTYQILILALDQDPILLTRAINVEKAQVDSCLKLIEGYRDTEDPDEATYRVLERYHLLGKRIANQDDAWFFSVARHRCPSSAHARPHSQRTTRRSRPAKTGPERTISRGLPYWSE